METSTSSPTLFGSILGDGDILRTCLIQLAPRWECHGTGQTARSPTATRPRPPLDVGQVAEVVHDDVARCPVLAVLALLTQAPASVVLFLVDLEAGLTDEALVALLAMVGLKNR